MCMQVHAWVWVQVCMCAHAHVTCALRQCNQYWAHIHRHVLTQGPEPNPHMIPHQAKLDGYHGVVWVQNLVELMTVDACSNWLHVVLELAFLTLPLRVTYLKTTYFCPMSGDTERSSVHLHCIVQKYGSFRVTLKGSVRNASSTKPKMQAKTTSRRVELRSYPKAWGLAKHFGLSAHEDPGSVINTERSSVRWWLGSRVSWGILSLCIKLHIGCTAQRSWSSKPMCSFMHKLKIQLLLITWTPSQTVRPKA